MVALLLAPVDLVAAVEAAGVAVATLMASAAIGSVWDQASHQGVVDLLVAVVNLQVAIHLQGGRPVRHHLIGHHHPIRQGQDRGLVLIHHRGLSSHLLSPAVPQPWQPFMVRSHCRIS